MDKNNRTPAPRKKPQGPDLPFSGKSGDAGTWVYDHRAGLCSILILYLFMAILFVGYKVIIRAPEVKMGIAVDLRTLEELEKEKARLEREVQMRQQLAGGGRSADAGDAAVRNIISNEGADLRDDRNTDMSAIRGQAENLGNSMRANRDAWDQGMREIEAMTGGRGGGGGKESGNANNDSRVKGNVMVSFSLLNPTRYSVDVITPGYLCERAGVVVVQIAVNRSGDVVSASIDRSNSDNDACMQEASLDAARNSRFNLDASAPERQSGTIQYSFMSQ